MDAVLEAAAQVFEREGLAATTNRIAERAGVSIGTLYQYFPNKQALLYALAERHLDAAFDRVDAVAVRLREQRPGWEDTIRALVAVFVDLHRDRPRLHHLMYEYTPRTPQGVERLHALHEAITAEVAHQLRRFGRGGPEPEHTAALLVHAADAQVHRVLLRRGGDPEELARTLLAMAEAPDLSPTQETSSTRSV